MGSGLDIHFEELDAHGARGLIVALSGGLDSTVLLHVLAESPAARARGLQALHVHHGLHRDADRWEEHCERLCAALDVPLRRERVQVVADGHGPEAAARQARHAAFRAACGDDDVVALAHHRDDQAETFLLRALRASGPDGLAAMRPWRPMGRGWLWRPLLGQPRETLRAYALFHGLAWVEDPSNASDAMDRNYLRLHVLPSLRRRWPHADAALAAGARACGEASDLLAAGDSIALEEVRGADDALDVVALKAVQPARRARVLRAWIASLDLPPLPAEGLRRIEHDLLQARADANARFAWHGAVVRRWRDRLYAHRSITPLDSGWSCQWMGDAELPLPDGGSLRLDPPVRLPAPVCVRGRRGGERIRLPGRAHRHVLKHVLQELGIPPWERERLPLLVGMDGDVMAVGDRVASHAFQAWLDDAGVRLVWTPPACRR